MARRTWVPIAVSCPAFLQNIDLSALNVALPAMSRSLGVPALHLNAVVAAYAVSLAAFLPLSAWMADRLGTRRTLCLAVIIFSLASALGGFADSASQLICFRVLQGLGGALMIPVGRLILVRAFPARELLTAMVWFTIPPTIGRLIGPLVGGSLVTYLSWQWIFWIHIPLGLLSLALTMLAVPKLQEEVLPSRFDLPGFLLMAGGLGAFMAGLETLGKGFVTNLVSVLLVTIGLALLAGYVRYSQLAAAPVIDLRTLRFPALRTNVLGAAPLRIAMFGAAFMLPLFLQFGLGLSPMSAGAVATGAAIGAVCTRFVTGTLVDRFTLRQLLMFVTSVSAVIFCCYSLFSPSWPLWLIFAVVLAGGLCTSVGMMALNSLGFAEIPRDRSSHATAIVAMSQQMCSAGGVVAFALLLRLSALVQGGNGDTLASAYFVPVFLAGGLLAASSLIPFGRLRDDAEPARTAPATVK